MASTPDTGKHAARSPPVVLLWRLARPGSNPAVAPAVTLPPWPPPLSCPGATRSEGVYPSVLDGYRCAIDAMGDSPSGPEGCGVAPVPGAVSESSWLTDAATPMGPPTLTVERREWLPMRVRRRRPRSAGQGGGPGHRMAWGMGR